MEIKTRETTQRIQELINEYCARDPQLQRIRNNLMQLGQACYMRGHMDGASQVLDTIREREAQNNGT